MRYASLTLLSLALLCVGTASASSSAKHAKSSHAATHTSTHASLKRTSAHTPSHGSSHAVSASHMKSAHSRASAPKAVYHAPMDTERATAIQTALIKAGYLTGEPTGVWDAQSMAAVQKLQADNGWQTKIVPDSRALIQLGLGPQPGNQVATK